jgi:hypothetical protein
MAVTNAEKQASWRERHLKDENAITPKPIALCDMTTEPEQAIPTAPCLSLIAKELTRVGDARLRH